MGGMPGVEGIPDGALILAQNFHAAARRTARESPRVEGVLERRDWLPPVSAPQREFVGR
jgi:hypothetical protein